MSIDAHVSVPGADVAFSVPPPGADGEADKRPPGGATSAWKARIRDGAHAGGGQLVALIGGANIAAAPICKNSGRSRPVEFASARSVTRRARSCGDLAAHEERYRQSANPLTVPANRLATREMVLQDLAKHVTIPLRKCLATSR